MDRDTFLALASALEDFGRAGSVARGGQRNSGQFYNTLAEAGQKAEQRKIDDKKAQAEIVRQSVLDKYKANDDARAQAKFEAETAVSVDDKDPNSEKSKVAQDLARKLMPTRDFSGMSAYQLKSSLPAMEKMYSIEENNRARLETARLASEDRRLDRQEKADARRSDAAKTQVSPISSKPLTDGQKKVDQDYAKHYNDFSGQGAAKARITIEQLEEFKKQLEDESKKTFQSGGGRVGSILPDALRTDQSLIWKRDIPAKANLVLKDLFGGQLSNDERKSESGTYYDDMLSPTENAKKLGEKINQLRAGYENESRKAKYFEKYGTLDGFAAEASGSGQDEEKYGADDKNAAARKWLEANPNDPRAEAIRQKLGGK